MSEKLRVVFNSPQSGYMSLGLRAGGREFATAVSCRPYDSLGDLLSALARLAHGEAQSAVVRWSCEPDELDFRFEADGGRLSLAVVHFDSSRRDEPNGRTAFAFAGARAQVCEAFRVALEDLRADAEVDEFESNWRREFPERQWREFVGAAEALSGATIDANTQGGGILKGGA
jgi:hypothetical protein